jgi:AraC family transcriptional regulator of adaptative response/methylated-DNA-[protein]-cysteine methyltransferase
VNTDYARIETAIRFIERNLRRQPKLDEIASELGLSPFHFQRLFQRWAGVSPKRFLQTLTVEHAKRLLEQSASVLDTTYELGLSGPGRLHDHFVAMEGVTPGEYKTQGEGLHIRYGVHPSPFGPILLAVTERGICGASFLAGESVRGELAELRRSWPRAVFEEDAHGTRAIATRIFDRSGNNIEPLSLFVKGTNFQVNVWRALLRVPSGALCSYDHLARAVGKPKAARAVGAAVAANRIAYLIPCHRVIRSVGLLGGYRWGDARKRALIGWETTRAGAVATA